MRVVVVIPKIPPQYSGAGLRGWRIAQQLARREIETHVLTFSQAHDQDDHIRVHALGDLGSRYKEWPGRIRRQLARIIALCRISTKALVSLYKLRPDVVLQIACHPAPQLVGLIALLLRIPVVACTTGAESDDLLTIAKSKYGMVRMRLVQRYAFLINQTPAMEQAALEAGFPQDRLQLIGNGVDVCQFDIVTHGQRSERRRQLNIPDGMFVFLCISPLVKRKGVLDILKAYSVIEKLDRPMGLVFVGPIRMDEESIMVYDEIAYAVEMTSGSDRMVLAPGRVDDVRPWLASADCLVHASSVEGFPNVIIEAMASGVPIICKSISGITDYILGDPHPDVVEVETDVELVDAMERAYRKGFADNEGIRKKVVDRFSQSLIIDKYVSVLRDASLRSYELGG